MSACTKAARSLRGSDNAASEALSRRDAISDTLGMEWIWSIAVCRIGRAFLVFHVGQLGADLGGGLEVHAGRRVLSWIALSWRIETWV